MSEIPEKSPYTEYQLLIIKKMIDNNADTKAVATELGITENDIDQVFMSLRRKYDKARKITNIYENWRKNPCLRKRLF